VQTVGQPGKICFSGLFNPPALLRSFGALDPREVWQQLEPSVGQILLILDQSLELFEPLQDAVEVCRFRSRIGAAQGAHNRFLVIRLLIFQMTFPRTSSSRPSEARAGIAKKQTRERVTIPD